MLRRKGNQTTLNIERQREINRLLDALRRRSPQIRNRLLECQRETNHLLDELNEDDLVVKNLHLELKEINVWHGDTVPDQIYHATIFQEKIVPAQVTYIEANAGMKASQLLPKLKRIAKEIVEGEGKLEYPDLE